MFWEIMKKAAANLKFTKNNFDKKTSDTAAGKET